MVAQERQKADRTSRLPPKPKVEPEFFTLGEAAKYLQFESEKSVVRLIKAGKLDAQKGVVRGKKRWVITRVNLNRYRLIHGDWLWRQAGSFVMTGSAFVENINALPGSVPTLDEADGQQFGHVFVYGDPPIDSR